jgi:hypothetical protein
METAARAGEVTPRPRGITVASLVAALPDLALAGVFFTTWVAPDTLGQKMVAYLMLMMLLEFIIIHSSAVMGLVAFARERSRRRAGAIVGLGLFYSLFVAVFGLAFKTWWPFVAFWVLTANRLLGVLVGQAPEGEERALIQGGWAVTCVAYLVFVFATTLLPIPTLGITDAVVARQDLPGSGLWVDEPHRVVAFGFFYFATVGWSELFIRAWFRPPTAAPG